jgi:hydroxypyruvate isomerase
MIKYSLCIEPTFTHLDFYDRIPLAAELGFSAIEFWNPAGRDIAKISQLISKNGLKVAACGLNDSWKVRLNAPKDLMLESIRGSILIAEELGYPRLIGMAGDLDVSGMNQTKVLIENLKYASDLLSQAGVTLVLEALNTTRDHKGYFLDSSKVGFSIIGSVGCENVRLLYDVYHMQIMEGNLTSTILENISLIGHFHSAGVPGRHEHFTGEINYPYLVKSIDQTNYAGYFGLEYWPAYDHLQSVKDVLAYLAA